MTTTLILVVLAVFAVGTAGVLYIYFPLWLQAYFSGADIGFLALILMSLRNVNSKVIVRCKVMAVQAGLPQVPTSSLEAQYLARGDPQRVITAMIAAHRAAIDLDWETASTIDLAGRDVFEAVQVSVNPKIIQCPMPEAGRNDTLYGVAKDGIQLKVRVRVTVRTNISRLVGGATESTVVARVGQSIVSAIGSCESYQDALGDPQLITRRVIEQGLDSQTAFEIVSIDIADIDVGTNIGAKLQVDQAETDIRIARAAAEKRRAMAIADLQQMKALVTEFRARLILSQSEIPSALAVAFTRGIGVDSSHSMLNAQALTDDPNWLFLYNDSQI